MGGGRTLVGSSCLVYWELVRVGCAKGVREWWLGNG